ncbi:MAG: hypothetical protein WCF84_15330 [Anaerolineae bacterium]
MEAKATSNVMYCTNHPQTETLLRCNKCDRPMCLKCVERTVVGYRCKECLGQQRVGYYNSTAFDYVLAAIVGLILSVIGGVVMSFIGGFWLFAIFVGPAAGGIISEGARRVIGRRRGRYIWMVVCATIIVGGLLGGANIGLVGMLIALLSGQAGLFSQLGMRFLLNIGLWIYLALAVSTAYARLRV